MIRAHHPAAPFAVACVGIAVFSCMDAVMKAQSIAIGAYSALLWRSVIGVGLAGTLFVGTGRRWPRGARSGCTCCAGC